MGIFFRRTKKLVIACSVERNSLPENAQHVAVRLRNLFLFLPLTGKKCPLMWQMPLENRKSNYLGTLCVP